MGTSVLILPYKTQKDNTSVIERETLIIYNTSSMKLTYFYRTQRSLKTGDLDGRYPPRTDFVNNVTVIVPLKDKGSKEDVNK